MTAYTSAATGNWSDAGSWSPSGVPGDGDTAVISGHTITIDENTTVGTDGGAGVAAVTVQSSGALIIGPVSVVFKGDVVNANCPVTIQAGSSITFGTGAGDTTYGYVGGTAHNQASQVLTLSGTEESPISWAGGWLNDGTGPWLQGCRLAGDGNVEMEGVGSSSVSAIRTSPTGSGSFTLKNVTLTDCGRISGTYNIGATCTYILDGVTFVGGEHATDSLRVENGSGYTSGDRIIKNCVFPQQVHLYTAAGFVIGEEGAGNYFGATLDATAGDWISAEGNFFEDQNNLIPGSLSNSYFCDPDSTDNPHNMQPLAQASPTYDGLIFENAAALNTSDAGDCILMPSPGSVLTYTIQNSIVLPAAGGRTSGCLFSALGNANVRVSCNHNTWFLTANDPTVNVPALGTVGETFNTNAGQVTSFKSNIAASPTSRSAYIYRNVNGSPNDDTVDAADADYNCVYNMAAGSAGGGYNAGFTGSPGANDLNVDPDFVDPTRNIASWDASLGGPGTVANAIAELKKRNTATYNSDYNISDLIAWVRAGFSPRNAALKNAGHDGTDIGAVAVTLATGNNTTDGSMALMLDF